MLTSLALLGVIVASVWLGAKLVFGRATRNTYIATTAMPVFLGFLLMRFGSDAEMINAGQMALSGIAMLGLMLILGGLICGLTITILGIVSGLARHQRRGRK